MSELKPCPFCGSEEIMLELEANYVSAFCEKCGSRAAFKTSLEEAAASWNMRHDRTCNPETEVLDTVDIGIGFLERLVDNCSDCCEPLTCDYSSNAHWRRVLPNYCSNCGSKVTK